ncbi:hypothetical protein ETH_00032620, partial [Eimeria tenella]
MMRRVSSVFGAAEMRRMNWVVVVVSGGRDCVSAAFVCVVMRVEGGMRISVQRQLAALVVRALDALVESVDVQAVLLGGMDGLGAQEAKAVGSVGGEGVRRVGGERGRASCVVGRHGWIGQRQLAALVVRALDALVESVDVQAVLLGGMDGLGAQADAASIECVWSGGDAEDELGGGGGVGRKRLRVGGVCVCRDAGGGQRQLAALVVRALDALVESVDVQAVWFSGMNGLGAQASVAGMRRMRRVSSVFGAAEMRRMSWVVVVVSGGRDCVSAAFVCVVMRVEGGMRISV